MSSYYRRRTMETQWLAAEKKPANRLENKRRLERAISANGVSDEEQTWCF